jgi:hypothetical protein
VRFVALVADQHHDLGGFHVLHPAQRDELLLVGLLYNLRVISRSSAKVA